MKTYCVALLIITLALLPFACIDSERQTEEMNEPAIFLTVKQNKTPNEGMVQGFVLNHAHYTAYQNTIFLITYYSHRSEKIGTEGKVLYQVIPPGERAPYSFKINPPPPPQVETAVIDIAIIDASPVTH